MKFLEQKNAICTYVRTKTACDLLKWIEENTCAVLLENLSNHKPTEWIQVLKTMHKLVYISLAEYHNLKSEFGLNPYRVSWSRQTTLKPIHPTDFKKEALQLCGFQLHGCVLKSQAI